MIHSGHEEADQSQLILSLVSEIEGKTIELQLLQSMFRDFVEKVPFPSSKAC